MSSPTPELIDELELCDLLKCSRRQIQAMRQSGIGPRFTRVGARAVRYDLADVTLWLEQRKRSSTSDPGPQPNVAV